MKLETRLEQLEHEFKVLKNEIQMVLLEIQEQVLNHSYPALRADEEEADAPMSLSKPEAARPNGQRQRPGLEPAGEEQRLGGSDGLSSHGNGMNGQHNGISHNSLSHNGSNGNGLHANVLYGTAGNGHVPPSLSPGVGPNGHVFPFKDALDDLLNDEETDDAGPSLREVSFAELKRGTGGEGRPSPKREPAAAPTAVNFALLADWVAESTRLLGRERTLKAVETYSATGNLAAAHKTMIVQLIELGGEEGPAEPPANIAAMQALVKLDQLLRGA